MALKARRLCKLGQNYYRKASGDGEEDVNSDRDEHADQPWILVIHQTAPRQRTRKMRAALDNVRGIRVCERAQ